MNHFISGQDSDASSYLGSEKFDQFEFGRNNANSNPLGNSDAIYNFQKSRRTIEGNPFGSIHRPLERT